MIFHHYKYDASNTLRNQIKTYRKTNENSLKILQKTKKRKSNMFEKNRS